MLNSDDIEVHVVPDNTSIHDIEETKERFAKQLSEYKAKLLQYQQELIKQHTKEITLKVKKEANQRVETAKKAFLVELERHKNLLVKSTQENNTL